MVKPACDSVRGAASMPPHRGRSRQCREVDEEDRRVTDAALRVLYDVLGGFDLPEARLVDAARALRSTLHGFAALEAQSGCGR